MSRSVGVRVAWAGAVGLAVASRLWNALTSATLQGYDAWGHVSYVLFIDLYRAIPYADQGWSTFHPPLHYLLGFLLAQAGDAAVLVRGLGLLSSAASLGTAGLAAWIVRRALPGRPLLAPLAFVAVAFLPVHVYTSPMPGNEQTAAFFSTLGFALFVRNQLRPQPTRRGDLAAGLAMGLALLTKFSGLLPLVAAASTLAWGALRSREGAPAWRAAARRGLLVALPALLICAPYYARNLARFGTPFQLSLHPLVSKVESAQTPGARSWLDYVTPAPRALLDPNVRAPHLLHSVWGSAYVSAWSDTRATRARAPAWTRTLPLWLGLLPSGLALVGFASSLRRALRGGGRGADPALLALTLVNLAAFVVMTSRVPTWAMLKASYLLQLSVPYGFYLAGAVDALARRGRRIAAGLAGAWIAVAGAVATLAFAPGVASRLGGETAPLAGVHAYFGDLGRAQKILRTQLALHVMPERRARIGEALAALLLRAGEAEAARVLYARSFPRVEPRSSPWVTNRLAVATALAGDRTGARALLDSALAGERLRELLLNRAALRALDDDARGAESDLREALALDATLAAAWHNLAWLLERRGDSQQAAAARAEAERLARLPPRGFPYGVGDGSPIAGQRFMLVMEGDGLALYRPARARTDRRGSSRAQ